jgi:hypothetical protein
MKLSAVRLIALGILVALALMLSACAKMPVMPPKGLVYNNYKAPLFLQDNYHVAGAGAAKTVEIPANVKHGVSETAQIAFPFYPQLSVGFGDAAVKSAAANGNIQKILYADYEYFSVFGVYNRFRVHAYGE